MAKLWTSSRTGITYDVTRHDADGRWEIVGLGDQYGPGAISGFVGLLQVAGVVAMGVVTTAAVSVGMAVSTVFITSAAVIALSNWPLVPVFLLAGALACLANPSLRRLVGARRVVAMILVCVALFVSTIVSVVAARHSAGFAGFVRLPWVAMAAAVLMARFGARRMGRIVLACCAAVLVSSILLWLMGSQSSNVGVNQIIATVTLAVVLCQILWWRVWSRVRSDLPASANLQPK